MQLITRSIDGTKRQSPLRLDENNEIFLKNKDDHGQNYFNKNIGILKS